MRKIIQISVKDYSITCTLDNEQKYVYDMNFVAQSSQEMLAPLKDKEFFEKVFIEFGSLAWPNGYDIHVNTIIRDGVNIEDVA